MTATEELRRMLDERGVEWHDTKIGKGFITVYEHDGITWIVTEHSSGRLSVKGCVKPTQGHYDGMTPEQAIAATLGAGTCKEVYLLMAIDIGDGREEVLGVYATEEAAMAAINENQFGYAFHHVRKQEVAE